MKTETIQFNGSGAVTLSGVLWMPEEIPHLILQVTHGMTEHMGRYEKFAEALTAAGIAVAGFDLRGHGKNPGDPKCATFGEGGWDAVLGDMHCFRSFLSDRFPNIPYAMLGFSLGSFLLRDYLNRYDDPVVAAVIMGTGWQPGFVLAVLKKIVKGQIRQAGFDHTTPLVRKLSFETYNQKFAPNRTPTDWLCANGDELDAYRADPLCREDISAGLFWQMLDAMYRTGGANAYDHWHKDIPVLLLSGQDDPVGDCGKGVRYAADAMKKAGLSHVQMELVPDARHDILHEIGCENTIRQISQFLNSSL